MVERFPVLPPPQTKLAVCTGGSGQLTDGREVLCEWGLIGRLDEASGFCGEVALVRAKKAEATGVTIVGRGSGGGGGGGGGGAGFASSGCTTSSGWGEAVGSRRTVASVFRH